MEAQQLEKLKYPIGKFTIPEIITSETINEWIETISSFPEKLKNEVLSLTDEQLDTPYREGGWTIRQLTHHCADSHMNAFIRFKLALTEENPTIKPYEEQLWAEQADYQLPIKYSLSIIENLHYRWAVLLKSLGNSDFERTYLHPAQGKIIKLKEVLGLYNWHCNHHLAHIINVRI